MKKYILAHDTGTGGDKAVITDLQGRVIHAAYRPYGLSYPRADWVEQDPDELWQAVAATTRQALRESGVDAAEILGVGISAQMFNTLLVDERIRPLHPMLSWLDVRAVRQADRLAQGGWPAFLIQHTGNLPTAKDIPPKILWLKDERPDLWARTAYLFDCKEYLVYQLTGRVCTDWVGASAYFLFDPHQRRWSEAACRRLDIPLEMLPPALPCAEVIGEVTPAAARLTGLLPGTPVVNGAGDVSAAQTGAGANRDGKAHLCIGTATWVGVSTARFRNHPEKPFWALSHIHPQKWVIAGEMETGGGALMWFRDALCQEEKRVAEEEERSAYALLSEMAQSTPPGAEKLLFLPWLTGERAPVLDHYARGGFVGLSIGHTKAHMARAVMEGVAYHVRWMTEALHDLGYSFQSVNAIGGGSQSPLWRQIIADVSGLELHVVEHPQEAGAMAIALTVAVGLGVYASVDEVDGLIGIAGVTRPNPALKARYDALYAAYRQVYTALAPINRSLHGAE
ncbi:MAG: FGGY-family carbohydrate kinase [Chloroflexi bacterium]|nr:FGGY-family carbohydrate kinase [Chloroflexota bacterium]